MELDSAESKISRLCSEISILKQQEMTAFVHCAKINSLIQSFKIIPSELEEYLRISSSHPNPEANKAIDNITSVTEELIQLCVQCVHDSGVQFILMSSTSDVFNHFFSIRETLIKSFTTLGLDSVVKSFKLSPEKLICQDQVDLKQISTILAQIKNQYQNTEREDIEQAIKDRYTSLQRKNIRISDISDDQLLILPTLPSAVNLCVKHEQIQYGKEIGHGYSGRVYEGKIAGHQEKVAIKVLNSVDNNALLLRSLRTEIQTLSILSHQSILKLIGYTNEPPFCLITELMVNGSLAEFLDKRPNELSPTERTIIAIDIAHGMEYIHDKCLIHRDLKSFNILLDENKRAKICDFGLVRVKSYEPSTGMIGTTQWMAPEVMMCSPNYDQKVDVYSYGILLWELLTGEKPHSNIPIAKLPTMIVKNNLRPTIPESTPKSLRNFIQSCWDQDPANRPTFSCIVNQLEERSNHFPGTNEDELRKIIGFDSFGSLYSSSSEMSNYAEDAKSDNNPEHTCNMAIRMTEEGIAEKDIEKIEQAGNELYGLLFAEKFDAIKEIVIPKYIELVRESPEELKPAMVLILCELLKEKEIFKKYIELGGEKLTLSLLDSPNLSVASSALTTFSKLVTKDNVTIDTIKGILKFSNYKNTFIRLKAAEVLILMTNMNPIYAQTIPSFLSYFLDFSTKDLPPQTVESIATTVLSLLKKVTKIGSHVVDKLIYIYNTTHERNIKKITIDCLVLASRFEETRHEFSREFWRKAADDLEVTAEIFKEFLKYLNSLATRDLLEALACVSSYNSTALEIITMYAKQKPDLVIPLLPISSDDYVKTIELYMQIPEEARNHFEVYVACADLIGGDDEQLALSMLKSLNNSEYFENAGVNRILVSPLEWETNDERLCDILKTVFHVAKLGPSNAILNSKPTIEELKGSMDENVKKVATELMKVISKWKIRPMPREKRKSVHRNSDSGVFDITLPIKSEGRRIVSTPSKPTKQSGASHFDNLHFK